MYSHALRYPGVYLSASPVVVRTYGNRARHGRSGTRFVILYPQVDIWLGVRERADEI